MKLQIEFFSKYIDYLWQSMVLIMAIVAAEGSQSALAIGLNYVDADDGFGGSANLSPLSAINSFGAPSNDNQWGVRSLGSNGTVLESGGGGFEDSSEIVQTITGLTSGNSYDLYAAYWSGHALGGIHNWTLRAGVSSGDLALYNRTGTSGTTGLPGAIPGTPAAAAVWDTLPPATFQGTTFTEDDRAMLLGYAGTMIADSSGEIQVFIDDLPGVNEQRSFFDGIAYVAAGTPIALTASINRTTGSLAINNPTSDAFQIKSYSVTSIAGALDATVWSTITATDASWTIVQPVNPANTPYTIELAETDLTGSSMGGVIAASSSLELGNVWVQNPIEDVAVSLTLADDSVIRFYPEYTGQAIQNGNFDGVGNIDLTDFEILLNNLHTDTSTLTLAEAFQRGDMTGDLQIDFSDFAAFRNVFNNANGLGAFTKMISRVPEPNSIVTILILGALFMLNMRNMRSHYLGFTCALMFCLVSTSSSSAVTLLAIDVDARSGDSIPGPPGPNTVSGFSSYTMQGTAGSLGTSTATVNGYSITLTAVNGAGSPQGAFDERDRGAPTTAPTLNQLYDDFIFAGVTTGGGGGIDLEINSGGALMPNTKYVFSLYAFDSSSSGSRSANWFDANAMGDLSLTASFDGNAPPTTDDQYKFSGIVQTDGSGNLSLQGREEGGGINVFMNGFEISIPLTLEVNTNSGTVRILNEYDSSFDMSYYEIRSESGSLNLSGWNGLDDSEPLPDPVGTGWDKAPSSNSQRLSEVNLQAMASLGQNDYLTLGTAFSVGGTQDLEFFYAGPDETSLRPAIVKYVTDLAGDFDGDSDVDGHDFLVWQRGGSPSPLSSSDLADWQMNYGTPIPMDVAATSVPEPATLALVVGAVVIYCSRRRRLTTAAGRCNVAIKTNASSPESEGEFKTNHSSGLVF